MRSFFATMVLGLAAGLATQAAAQDAAPSATPTPEAAARFIDSVLGNRVTLIGRLDAAQNHFNAKPAEHVSTKECKTTLVFERASLARGAIVVNWRSYGSATPFVTDAATGRSAAKLIVRAVATLADLNDVTEVADSELSVYLGIVAEPGTKEMTDRLLRAFEFYGKSCAAPPDGPF